MYHTLNDIEGRYVVVPPEEGVSLAEIDKLTYPAADDDREDGRRMPRIVVRPIWYEYPRAPGGPGRWDGDISFADLTRTIDPAANPNVWAEANSAPFWQTSASGSIEGFGDGRLVAPMQPSAPPAEPAGAGISFEDMVRPINPAAVPGLWDGSDSGSAQDVQPPPVAQPGLAERIGRAPQESVKRDELTPPPALTEEQIRSMFAPGFYRSALDRPIGRDVGFTLWGKAPPYTGYGRNSTAELSTAREAPSQEYNNRVTENLLSLGVSPRVAEVIGPKLGAALQMFSPVGVATSAEDAAYYAERGNYPATAGSALGIVPVVGKPVGSAVSKGLRTALPMDEASRTARARGMRFYLEHPLAHGTAGPEFPAFDSARGGATTGAAPARAGVFVEWHPERRAGIADYFAEVAANTGLGNPRVMPLVHRAENPASLRLSGDETNLEVLGALKDAWAAGHDAVLIRNYTSHGGKSGDILVVKDPAQLRSRFAVFDPSKSHLADLLASLAIVPAAGALTFGSQDRQDSRDLTYD